MKLTSILPIAQGVAMLLMGVALYFLFNSYSNVNKKLGKATSDANHNEEMVRVYRNLYIEADNQKRDIILSNNEFIASMAKADADRMKAINSIRDERQKILASFSQKYDNLGSTPVGQTCEQRLEYVEDQLDKYRGLVYE